MNPILCILSPIFIALYIFITLMVFGFEDEKVLKDLTNAMLWPLVAIKWLLYYISLFILSLISSFYRELTHWDFR